MPSVTLAGPADFDGFRAAARSMLMAGVIPSAAHWRVGDAAPGLFDDAVPPAAMAQAPLDAAIAKVPRAFVDLAAEVACHADLDRFDLLYRMLWRLGRGERELLRNPADPDMARAGTMARTVRREIHKLHAFVRFREVAGEGGSCWLAWFEPDHHVTERATPFFARRFPNMRWSILTPEVSAHWDLERLTFAPGADRSAVPDDDALEGHWRVYFASIFNPARLNPAMMRREMPERFWKNLPEATLIAPLIASARSRTAAMVDAAAVPVGPRAKAALPAHADHASALAAAADDPLRPADLPAAREAARHCRRCPLWRPATQTVFGEGPADAAVMIVGEQPGDQEDLTGRPFVGPAGKLFDRALGLAAIDRGALYITNAVKHFKFEPRGKRRIHAKPDAGEIELCRWWVDLERALVAPRLTVAMGATAARSLLGEVVAITRERGRIRPLDGGQGDLLLTVHPSFILRLPDPAQQADALAQLAADLALMRPYLAIGA